MSNAELCSWEHDSVEEEEKDDDEVGWECKRNTRKKSWERHIIKQTIVLNENVRNVYDCFEWRAGMWIFIGKKFGLLPPPPAWKREGKMDANGMSHFYFSYSSLYIKFWTAKHRHCQLNHYKSLVRIKMMVTFYFLNHGLFYILLIFFFLTYHQFDMYQTFFFDKYVPNFFNLWSHHHFDMYPSLMAAELNMNIYKNE